MTADDCRHEVIAAVNRVIDPCSAGIAAPTGLWEMGLVERVDIRGGDVDILLATTSPGCMFVGSFQAEVEERVSALDWVDRVTVDTDYRIDWDESRMSEAARQRLNAKHVEPRGLSAAQRVRDRRRRLGEAVTHTENTKEN